MFKYINTFEEDSDTVLALIDAAKKLNGSALQQSASLTQNLVSKSTAKAAQSPISQGTLKDDGQPARFWVFGFASYLQACNETGMFLL